MCAAILGIVTASGRDRKAVRLSASGPRPNGLGKLSRAKASDRVKIERAAGRDGIEARRRVEQIAAGQCPPTNRIEREGAADDKGAVRDLAPRKAIQGKRRVF
jgi:hypothetical protein